MFKKFFSEERWLPFAFVLHLFVFEFLAARGIYNALLSSFRSALFAKYSIGLWAMFSFFSRIFLVNLVLGLALYALEAVFHVKRRVLFYLFTMAYMLSVLLVQKPVVFQAFSTLTEIILVIQPFTSGLLLILVSFAILAFLNFSYLQSKQFKTAQLSAALFANLCLAFYFYSQMSWSGQVPVAASQIHASHARTKPNIILYTFESLDSEALERAAASQPGLKKYLDQSLQFTDVVSPSTSSLETLASVFTSSYPPQHQVRSNPPAFDPRATGLLKTSPLADFKKQGYRLELISDDPAVSYLADTSIFDEVQVSAPSLRTDVSASLLQNWSVLGFFDNAVGEMIFPELKNRAFLNGNQVHDMDLNLAAKVAAMQDFEQPTLLVFHTRAFSTPASRKFTMGRHRSPRSQKRLLASAKVLPGNTLEKSIPISLDQEKAGLSLGNVLASLEASGQSAQTVLAVASLNIRPYPYDQMPFIQVPNLIDPQQGNARLWLRAAQLPAGEIESRVSLVDLLPTLKQISMGRKADAAALPLLADAKNEKTVYTETGFWSVPDARDAWEPLDPQLTSDLFAVPESLDGFLLLNDRYAQALALQKQRAVYKGEFKLLQLPTKAGYSYVLCNVVEDANCEHNLDREKPDVLAGMKRELAAIVAPEIKAGLLPPMSLANLSAEDWSREKKAMSPWARLYMGVTLVRGWRDFRTGTELLDALALDKNLPAQVSITARDNLIPLCSNERVYSANFHPDFIAELNLNERSKSYDPDLLVDLMRYGSCAKLTGELLAFKKYHELVDDKYRSRQNQRAIMFLLPGRPAGADQLRNYMTHPESRNLARAFLGSQRYSLAPNALPALDLIADQSITHAEKEKRIDRLFSHEFNYQLGTELRPYYEIGYNWRFAKNPREALSWLDQQISLVAQPQGLYSMADLEHAELQTNSRISLDEIESFQSRAPASVFPSNVTEDERGLTLYLMRQSLCQSEDDICDQAMAAEDKTPSARIWKRLDEMQPGKRFDEKTLTQLSQGAEVSPYLRWLILEKYSE